MSNFLHMKSHVILSLLFVCCVSLPAATWVVGPGEQFTHPNEAFSQMTSSDTVLIRQGQYHAKFFRVGQKNNIVIIGEDAELLGTDFYGSVFMVDGCTNVVISGIRMRHEFGSQWEICYGGVLEIAGCKNVLIQDCEMNGCGAIGLQVYSSTGVVCTGSHIHHNNRAAIRVPEGEFNDPGLMQFEHLLLFDNHFHDNGNLVFLYPWVDNLRVRESYPDGKVLGTLTNRQRVVQLEGRSDTRSTIVLRGITFTEYWIRIQTDDGLIGWVFKGALTPSLEDILHHDPYHEEEEP